MVNFEYMYSFNKERYREIYKKELLHREPVNAVEYEDGIILPAIPKEGILFGIGGVLNRDKKYIEESGIISYGRDVYKKNQNPIIAFGGSYNVESVKVVNEKVVYAGLITNHWGHFLIDFSTRLWYMLECDENFKIAFVIKEGQKIQLIPSIKRFLQLLNINEERILFINTPTKFSSIIVPQCSYVTNGYYTDQFLKVFDTVVARIEEKSKEENTKIYFTRSGWYKSKGSEVGEDLLVDLFRKNGFKIVSPENCTLDEQISLIRSSDVVVAIEGTIPHNMLFSKRGQKIIIINKTYNFNSMQKDINIMRDLTVDYIDSYASIFPVPMGDGPFAIVYSEELERYIKDNKMILPNKLYIGFKYRGKTLKKLIKMARESKVNIKYNTDLENSAYFDPLHLEQFYELFYYSTYPISLCEKTKRKYNELAFFVKKVLFRLKTMVKNR